MSKKLFELRIRKVENGYIVGDFTHEDGNHPDSAKYHPQMRPPTPKHVALNIPGLTSLVGDLAAQFDADEEPMPKPVKEDT